MTTLRVSVVALLLAAAAHAQFNKATVLLSGKVRDAETGKAIHARVQFFDGATQANQVMANNDVGYQAVMKPGKTYTAKIVSERYYTNTEEVSVPAVEKFTQSTQDFSVKPIHENTVLYAGEAFDYGSVQARPEAATALMNLGKKMKENYEIEVRVDAAGDPGIDGQPWPAPDQGTKRAQAVKALLVSNGASANRVQVNAKNTVAPAPAPVQEEKVLKKGKKAKKEPKKKAPKVKPGKKGKKDAIVPSGPPASGVTITIVRVHSLDD